MTKVCPSVITLRSLLLSDVDDVMKWENDPSLWHLSGVESEYSRSQIIDFVENHIEPKLRDCDDQLRLVIECNNRAIGAVDLYEYDPSKHMAYVGILIYDQGCRGRGFGASALRSMEEYATTYFGVCQFRARVHQGNVASVRLFQSCGYVLSECSGSDVDRDMDELIFTRTL